MLFGYLSSYSVIRAELSTKGAAKAMFDTIKVGIKVTLSRQEIDLIQWTQTNSSCNSKKNSSKTIFKKIHDSSKKEVHLSDIRIKRMTRILIG